MGNNSSQIDLSIFPTYRYEYKYAETAIEYMESLSSKYSDPNRPNKTNFRFPIIFTNLDPKSFLDRYEYIKSIDGINGAYINIAKGFLDEFNILKTPSNQKEIDDASQLIYNGIINPNNWTCYQNIKSMSYIDNEYIII